MSENIYYKRMNDYYPQVISTVKDFQAILKSEYPEVEDLYTNSDRVLANEYLTTMDESRIKQYEKILNITPLADSTLDDRRSRIIARIRGLGKLNSAMISNIVSSFTGGTATSYIYNSVLYVIIMPPDGDKSIKFSAIERELTQRKPAHLGLSVERQYYTWQDIYNHYDTWQAVYDGFDTWQDVEVYVPTT